MRKHIITTSSSTNTKHNYSYTWQHWKEECGVSALEDGWVNQRWEKTDYCSSRVILKAFLGGWDLLPPKKKPKEHKQHTFLCPCSVKFFCCMENRIKIVFFLSVQSINVKYCIIFKASAILDCTLTLFIKLTFLLIKDTGLMAPAPDICHLFSE